MEEIQHVSWQFGSRSITGCKLGQGNELAICLPGFSLTGEWMARRYPALWQGKTCYFLDWPGLNDESLQDTPFDIKLIHDWIQHILKEHPWDKIQLISHSFGARISFKLLAENTFCTHLCLIAPVTRLRFWEDIIRLIPTKLYTRIISFILKPDRLHWILTAAIKMRLLHNQEYGFLKTFCNSDKLNRYLIHYACVLPYAYVSEKMLQNSLSTLSECKIYLFVQDRLCDNKFWLKRDIKSKLIDVKVLKGSHFTKIT